MITVFVLFLHMLWFSLVWGYVVIRTVRGRRAFAKILWFVINAAHWKFGQLGKTLSIHKILKKPNFINTGVVIPWTFRANKSFPGYSNPLYKKQKCIEYLPLLLFFPIFSLSTVSAVNITLGRLRVVSAVSVWVVSVVSCARAVIVTFSVVTTFVLDPESDIWIKCIINYYNKYYIYII